MILPYIIKSALTLALLYTCIMPLLEKETFHRLNRIIVLGCLLLSFIIPLIHFTDGTNQTIDMVRQAVQLPEIQIDGNANKQSVWSLTDILICIYTLGGVAMLSLTAIQTMSLMLRLRRCEHITDNKGNVIVLTDYATSPFCLFHYIVMSHDDYANNRCFVLTHEQEHIRLRHYIDLIILQFATIIQWFNPFVWLIGKNLKTIHEFEVDEAVLNKGIDATQYQKFLVVKAVGLHQRAGLVDMVAQDLLQCGIQQMGSAVGTHNSLPAVHIDGSGNGIAHPELTGEHLAVVHELTALVLQDVGHFKLSVAGGDDAVVGHLAAHLGIEGSLVQNNDGLHAGHDSLRQLVFHHQSQHLGISDGGMVVTHELSGRHVAAELDTGPA